MEINNILSTRSKTEAAEVFVSLLETNVFKLEKIVSTGQATPTGQWYDQDRDEWVLLLSGKAALMIEGEKNALILGPGDFLLIPAHKRHRVDWTAAGTETVWLALHFTRP